MLKHLKQVVRESVKEIALSLFISSLFILSFFFFLEKKVNVVFSLLNTITITEKKEEDTTLSFDSIKKRLKNYPSYGTKYGTLKINSIDFDLPLYHGDTLDILNYGIGHYAGSYFPGESGSIVLAGHNNQGFLRRLPEVQVGDQITIETTYGTFYYEMTSSRIIDKKEEYLLPIQNEEELLMIYTCDPVTAIGLTNQRYVVYAKRVVGEV